MTESLSLAAIIAGIIIVAAWGYVEWLKLKDADLDTRIFLIEQLVQAAEQLYKRGTLTSRYDYVMDRLQARFPAVPVEELSELIEAAVYRLNERKLAANEIDSRIDDNGGAYWLGSGRQN